ncbi:acetyl esterase/lipase [Microbacterium sp. BE35]|uniref:alpha/beta hydrolase n=1 Tax=Microbacterium sp. BE35 TaxID=2817773 RepID=UPI00285C93A2|nr:prolyl oligopeptidase family serine peptidase [Microbacterium sp. BE35]MDR7188846.1 acetyl esterase/lipase [Microbacterium sp. BE35]
MTSKALVLPGGSYRRHAPHEAEPVASWLRSLGIDADILRYPVGMPHPAAHDAIGARIAQLRAAGADRVLLVGFSAGGHAAGLAALRPAGSTGRVDGLVLGYPVVSLEKHSHQGSSEVLLGDADTAERRIALSLESLVTADAPPSFLFHSFDDEKVPVEHSLLLSSALHRARIPHELHLYPLGGHGCGLGGDLVPWTHACAAWLARGGWLPDGSPPA